MDFWNYKNDSFATAIKAFFTEHSIPGNTDKQKADNTEQIVRKIEDGLRREPIPEAILLEWRERFEPQRIRQLSAVMSMKPRTTIRLNVLKADIAGFGQSKTAEDLMVKRGKLSPFAYDVGSDVNPSSLPVFERGIFELEDEASQFASLLVNARPGQRILDICAREGDHSLCLAAMMKNKGSLFVYDSDPTRVKTLKARAEKAGLENYRIVGEGQISEVKGLDAVLVDAPCSGTGQLSRRPELKWRFKKEDLPKLQKVQASLLREAARKLKLGGRVIYVSSSLNLSENEHQIENFLKNSHNSFRLVSGKEYLENYVVDYVRNFYGLEYSEETLKALTTFEPYIFVSPDDHGTNGLFAAVIERIRISS
jgi:16S rRNA (cytosine967-C5)-methyltransferase